MNAAIAQRSIGAMFFSVFGGAWLLLWCNRQFAGNIIPVVATILLTAMLLLFFYRRYGRNREALGSIRASPHKKRVDRMFHLINFGQWIVILVVANVLINMHHSQWVIPAVILIVGMHFLPLGRLFSNPPHYLTGAALIALAVLYPLLARNGPLNPLGCLGAGLILWASALWTIKPTTSSQGIRVPGSTS